MLALERSDSNGRRLFNHSNYKKTASQQYVSFKKKRQMSLYYNTVIATQRKVSKAYSVEKRQAVKWLLLGPASCSMQRRWQTVSVRNKVFGYYVNTEMSVPLLFTQLVIAERRKGGWWWWWGIVLPYSSHMCIRRGTTVYGKSERNPWRKPVPQTALIGSKDFASLKLIVHTAPNNSS
jgi:hypothetical protein